MKKYLGYNCHNNNVVVDYTNKSVKFEPVSKHSTFYYFYLNSLSQISKVWLGLFFFMSFPIIILRWGLHYPQVYLFQVVYSEFAIMTAILYLLIPLIYLPMFVKSWRNVYFGRFNATICKITNLFWILDFGGFIPKKITPDKLMGNALFIPRFSNVYLEYDCTGDFKNIEKVQVHNHYKKNGKPYDSRFYAIFTFTNPVKTGYMNLKYY